MSSKKTSKNVVEINGQLYDASSGLPAATPITKDPTKSRVIDGFVKGKSGRAAASKAKDVHRSTKKSRTLNRSTIKKPKVKKNPSKHEIITATRTPESRLKRARQSTRSLKISKFGRSASDKPKSVASAAEAAPVIQARPKTSKKEQLIAQSMARVDAHAKEKVIKPRRITDIIQRKPKTASIIASVLAVLILGGYVVYLNIPNMALRVAAREAGFEANMPGYSPPGYSFGGPISYEAGRITIRFNSNTSDRSFAITERETNWDSQSLLDNHVTRVTNLYQTYQERGLTIYVYEGSQATWVNGGIWYSIEGDSTLNTEQLIRIASSL